MSYAASLQGATRPTIAEWLLNGVVLLMFASAFVVYIEPAPVDLMFLIVLLFFVSLRLHVTLGIAPLFLMLVLYNLGGLISYSANEPYPEGLMFVITSAYMAVSGVVIAYYVASNPVEHMRYIGRGWIIGAFLAAVWALIDYFQLPSPFQLQIMPGRATGLFKDPNVFSTFLVFPLVLMLQKMMTGDTKHPVLLLPCFCITLLALFLSFSRGAWMNVLLALTFMTLMTYKDIGSNRLRLRILLYVSFMFLIAVVAFSILMSIPAIQQMFETRFQLIQSYDGGETGRFGNQLRSLPDLITKPFGYGPFNFGKIYGQAPHNTFVNAFACYGWLGGIVYFGMIVTSIYIGFKTAMARAPWQMASIATFACLLSVILQGIQIDTEHWRHFYWMLGMMWGLFAATLHYGYFQRRQPYIEQAA
jgi:hypothetical protein